MITSYVVVTGTNSATNAAADATVVAAQGAGKSLYVLRGYVAVHLAAVGTGGKVALENGAGGTRFFEADANAVGFYPINLGDEGYPLTADTLLNLTVDGAVTTQATATATLICKVVG